MEELLNGAQDLNRAEDLNPAEELNAAEQALHETEDTPTVHSQALETESQALETDVFVAEALVEPNAPASPLKAIIEAAIYITDEPLTADQIAAAVQQPIETVRLILTELVAEYAAAERGLAIRELAGGYKMSTKPEHHEAIRRFVRNLQPPLKLSLAALETLAVIAYKQPITSPEIMEIRGVQGTGVLKTLLDRRLIATAGRKNVVGKPMLYKTTREFLVQFGLNSVAELPSLKEFEELSRFALAESSNETSAAEPETVSPDNEPDRSEPEAENA